jgi:hypothetical protein
MIYSPGQTITSGTYTITVGAGGIGSNIGTPGNATNGGNSVFNTLTAIGGGYGGTYTAGTAGGSGGGGYGTNSYTGGAGTTGQGYAGGTGQTGNSPYNFNNSAGGGGAGGVGGNGQGWNVGGGNGGPGALTAITGTPSFYAGGGGGSKSFDFSQGGTSGIGGIGGGGAAGQNNSSNGISGVANTGGGGGGGANQTSGIGGPGGSGIVIIRYPTNPGTFPLDSVSATPSLIFSTRRLRTGYTGPVIQLSLANTFTSPQDFYFVNGALNTNSIGTGTSFTSWVGAGTAYVSIWYDQSGNGKNATGVSGSAVVYNNVRGFVDFTGTGIYMTLPIGTLPSSQVPSSICFKNGTMSGSGERGLLSTGTQANNQSNDVGINSTNYPFISTYGTNPLSPVITVPYGSVTSILASSSISSGGTQSYSLYTNGGNLVTGTVGSVSFTPSGLVDILGSSRNNTGGQGAPSTNSFNGQLYWLSIYSSALNVPDRMTVEMQ